MFKYHTSNKVALMEKAERKENKFFFHQDLSLWEKWERYFESAGAWLVALSFGLIILIGTLDWMQHRQTEQLNRERILFNLIDIRSRIENSLAIGLSLSKNTDLQYMIEKAIARDYTLYSIKIIDQKGQIVLDTDRGSIGETVAHSLLKLAISHAKKKDTWLFKLADQQMLGTVISNSFGEPAAYVVISYPSSQYNGWSDLNRKMFIKLSAALLIFLLISIFFSNKILKKNYFEDGLGEGFDNAKNKLKEVENRLNQCFKDMEQSEEKK